MRAVRKNLSCWLNSPGSLDVVQLMSLKSFASAIEKRKVSVVVNGVGGSGESSVEASGWGHQRATVGVTSKPAYSPHYNKHLREPERTGRT